ncbi:winged helix-turn-helix domain-containing protein [Thalassomonas actiniarum]|uniref:Winged helix-turn-helix domain-containing protein n=1 Tax=Thalassomonas actiniarum TaxID=485447 RepID=A0AAF0C1T9_9GAMM|nr:winged helix-turn-helix domain-containing protein [Thalassomonas actiniarum]WDD97105.1 winged helix-turn-helix domain-containing protein [Thalassomonas actiniarum]
MEARFAEYRFVCDQLILYKHEEIIPLKRNQALLLHFFIANPDAIHSKDAIMGSVWQDKVVSEQVVFQTISQLRAILGTDAIKTFSRQGYKWQLALRQADTINSKPADTVPAEKAPQVHKRPHWAAFIFGALIAVGIYFLQALASKELVTLHLVQSGNAASINQKALPPVNAKNIAQGDIFSVEPIQQNHSPRQLFAAPKLAWQQAGLPMQDWLLWTDTFSSSKGIFLNYGLSHNNTLWHGYIFAKTPEQLEQKLSRRLMELHRLGLFIQSNNALDISTLTSMQKIAPNDPDLLLLLADYYFEVKQLDVAMTYAQKLANLDPSYGFSPYRAKAQWLIAELYKERHSYQLANNSLSKMSATLAGTPLWALSYENISAKAWLAYKQHDFDTMFNVLEQAIAFGQKQGDPLTLFELHIMYSILAKKGGDDHKKYAHLNEAQALLLKHGLDESNFAVVFYHFAIFTRDNSKALPYLEKILALPRTARNGWIIDHASDMLIEHYIEQQDYQTALSSLDNQPESPEKMLSLAKIYHGQQAQEQARPYFEKAFELARLQYKTRIAIDSALMLFQLSAHQAEKQAEYMAYLQENANEKWLKKQMDILANK